MDKKLITRFAPSPTGFLTFAGARTALFNYLIAKKNDGVFALRIEDTDKSRTVSNAANYIKESLTWLGLPWDGDIVVQSENNALYTKYALELVDKGFAYYAFDTTESLAELRGNNKEKPISYNCYTRERMKNSLTLSKEEVTDFLNNGTPYVIRFKTEKNRTLLFNDIIRGEVVFNTNNVDDKVLIKNDGKATYFLANTVDDITLGVTHVIKGNEWLSSMPIIILLYEALGVSLPIFAHLPLVMDEKGQKISKRKKYNFPIYPLSGEYVSMPDGEFVSVTGFKDAGYDPDALLNYMVLLGWTPKGSDIISLSEMIAQFELTDVHNSDAMFDIKKLKFLNKEYLKNKPLDYLYSFINKGTIFDYDDERLRLIADIALERSNFNHELNDAVKYFFDDVDYSNTKSKNTSDFNKFAKLFSEITFGNTFDSMENIKSTFEGVCQSSGVEKGKVLPDLRNALCGGKSGADLVTTMYILGVAETQNRIQDYVTYLNVHLKPA